MAKEVKKKTKLDEVLMSTDIVSKFKYGISKKMENCLYYNTIIALKLNDINVKEKISRAEKHIYYETKDDEYIVYLDKYPLIKIEVFYDVTSPCFKFHFYHIEDGMKDVEFSQEEIEKVVSENTYVSPLELKDGEVRKYGSKESREQIKKEREEKEEKEKKLPNPYSVKYDPNIDIKKLAYDFNDILRELEMVDKEKGQEIRDEQNAFIEEHRQIAIDTFNKIVYEGDNKLIPKHNKEIQLLKENCFFELKLPYGMVFEDDFTTSNEFIKSLENDYTSIL